MNIFGLERHLKRVCVVYLRVIKRFCKKTKTKKKLSVINDEYVVERLSKGSLLIALSQAEKEMEAFVHEEMKITDRCYTLIGILGGSIPLISTYLLKEGKSNECAIASIILLIINLCILIWLASPKEGYSVGDTPRRILDTRVVDSCIDCGRDEEKEFILVIIKGYQKKIDSIAEANRKRAKCFKAILISLSVTGILFVITQIIPIF